VNRLQLIDAFRARVQDTKAPYLWNEADELQEFLDDAHNEAAERARLLRDTTTAEICEIAIEANIATYPIDQRVLEVLRAKLDDQQRPLVLTTTESLDIDWPGWEDETAGVPERLAIDPAGAGWEARLVPAPTANTLMRLQVYRLPLASIAKDKDEPEIHPRLHVGLLDWMEYRAYSKKDAETQNDEKAAASAAAFAANFGPKRDAKTNRAQHDMQFPVVRPIGL
jgi:hypothetical protein